MSELCQKTPWVMTSTPTNLCSQGTPREALFSDGHLYIGVVRHGLIVRTGECSARCRKCHTQLLSELRRSEQLLNVAPYYVPIGEVSK